MSDCPHHPGLKRPSIDWRATATPDKEPRAYPVAIISPDGCPECLQGRVKALRNALADAAHLAVELMQHPCCLDRKEATARVTKLLNVYYSDVRDWYLPC